MADRIVTRIPILPQVSPHVSLLAWYAADLLGKGAFESDDGAERASQLLLQRRRSEGRDDEQRRQHGQERLGGQAGGGVQETDVPQVSGDAFDQTGRSRQASHEAPRSVHG
ncbi:hypothetical protein [Streptomyces sp. NPDC051994]|uniref:hypothetical protein n=1 Tax=unclassified Streptomyces TaxID=2593676 RepID=UPI00344887EC